MLCIMCVVVQKLLITHQRAKSPMFPSLGQYFESIPQIPSGYRKYSQEPWMCINPQPKIVIKQMITFYSFYYVC